MRNILHGIMYLNCGPQLVVLFGGRLWIRPGGGVPLRVTLRMSGLPHFLLCLLASCVDEKRTLCFLQLLPCLPSHMDFIPLEPEAKLTLVP